MKILCECGGVIVDQTDYLPNKGYIISDQDWFDFMDAMDNAIEKSGPSQAEKERACMKIRSLAIRLTKIIYQCNKCGRLYISNNDDKLEIYNNSEDKEEYKLLESTYGEKWKRPLIGDWLDSRAGNIKGYLWCINVKGDEGNFDEWDLLERTYYRMLKELEKNNTLRYAILKKNNKIIHEWEEISE